MSHESDRDEAEQYPPKRKYFGTFNEKGCEDEGFGFDKADNFTVEFVLCWHSFHVKFKGEAWTYVSRCQQEIQGFGRAHAENS